MFVALDYFAYDRRRSHRLFQLLDADAVVVGQWAVGNKKIPFS